MYDLILCEYAPPNKTTDVIDECLSLGPRTLLNAGLLPALSWAGVQVPDAAIIPWGFPSDGAAGAGTPLDGRKSRLLASTKQLAERTHYAVTQDHLPLTLGDCTAGVGVYAGLKQRWDDVAVVWVDAHCDLNTEESTLTGYFGGMPLAAVLGESLPWLTRAVGMRHPCDDDKVALVGAREFDPFEKDYLLNSGIAHVTPDELNDWVAPSRSAASAGGNKAAAATVGSPSSAPAKVARVVDSAESVYLHIDVDSLDPSIMPSVTFPSPGGLRIDSLLALAGAIGSSGKVRAITISSFNPGKPGALESAAKLVSLIAGIAAECDR